jgi:hypothetical protein
MGRPRFALIALIAAAACGAPPRGPQQASASTHVAGCAWPKAEALFHRDPRWLGADAALTIPLDEERTLWLFGDTFVAKTPVNRRSESAMPHNTVAIQTGRDPRDARIEFAWRTHADGTPASFFPDAGERWYWPGHGLRLPSGPLVVFLFKLRGTPNVGLGFASDGYALAVIDAPDAPLSTWKPRIVDAPALPFDALPATAVVREHEHVVALATRQAGIHAAALVRYSIAGLARGELSDGEWWGGDERGWMSAESIGIAGPAFVIDDAGAECSVHWDRAASSFVHVASYGFGATVIGVRHAPALIGPWSEPEIVYRPPESDGPKPFVYAAKAHPELEGPREGDLVVTYATNSFEFADMFTERGARELYWPRFVLVRAGE